MKKAEQKCENSENLCNERDKLQTAAAKQEMTEKNLEKTFSYNNSIVSLIL